MNGANDGRMSDFIDDEDVTIGGKASLAEKKANRGIVKFISAVVVGRWEGVEGRWRGIDQDRGRRRLHDKGLMVGFMKNH
jgi:hypothetical protein